MAAKTNPTKRSTAKKTPAKKAPKGKRYTDAEKSEILAFVNAQGRGGQTKAAAKFGVSALTISNWRKKGGKAKTKSKVATKVKVAKAGGDPWAKMVTLKKDIDVMEGKLAAKKAEFSKLAKKL
jgi:transposase-like protein